MAVNLEGSCISEKALSISSPPGTALQIYSPNV